MQVNRGLSLLCRAAWHGGCSRCVGCFTRVRASQSGRNLSVTNNPYKGNNNVQENVTTCFYFCAAIPGNDNIQIYK